MKKILPYVLALLPLFAAGQLNYPATEIANVSDTYFGVKIDDPYRWLENIKDPVVLEWFQKQADFTNLEMKKISGQETLMHELATYDKAISEKIKAIAFENGLYFYEKRKLGEPVAKLYYRRGISGQEKLLFDPTAYIPGKVIDYEAEVSSDGTRILLNISQAGSEIGDIRVLDVASAKLLNDKILHSFGNFLDGSNNKIIYFEAKNYDTHAPEARLNLPTKLHPLGKDTGADMLLVNAMKYPELNLLPSERAVIHYYHNSSYMLLLKRSVETNVELFYAPSSQLLSGKIHWKPLTSKSDQVKQFFVSGKFLYAQTAKGNPYFNIIKINLDNPNLQTAEKVYSGNDEWKISNVSQSKNFLAIIKSRNEQVFETWLYNLKTGKLKKVKTPIKGNVEGTALSTHNDELVLANYSWVKPYNFYSYNASSGHFSKKPFYMATNLPDLDNIVLEEKEIPSHDGVMMPISIYYDKTMLKKDGSNPLFMQGYGAYGMSRLPGFNPSVLCLLRRGVVMVTAHVRGGGEKGEEWYLGGKKTTKSNTWKDLNASAEYLIKSKYTSPEKLGITGASAGGILIGRAITTRPDLYKVAIPKVGCLNALRMEFSPNGPINIPEFGTVKDSIEFKALMEMDAYQHINKDVKYPAQLITTGFNDPRVESYIPAKFAAKMQADNSSTNPVFLHVDYKAGHFGGTTTEEKFRQTALEYAFFLWQTGDKGFQIR